MVSCVSEGHSSAEQAVDADSGQTLSSVKSSVQLSVESSTYSSSVDSSSIRSTDLQTAPAQVRAPELQQQSAPPESAVGLSTSEVPSEVLSSTAAETVGGAIRPVSGQSLLGSFVSAIQKNWIIAVLTIIAAVMIIVLVLAVLYRKLISRKLWGSSAERIEQRRRIFMAKQAIPAVVYEHEERLRQLRRRQSSRRSLGV